MSRTSNEEHEEHLAATEEALVKLRSQWRVIQHLMKRFKGPSGQPISKRTARRWILEVHQKWGAEAVQFDRKNDRSFMRATLNEILASALGRTIVVKDDDGKVVLDPQTGYPILKANPDLQRALHAATQLRALDGLDEAQKIKVEGGIVLDKPLPDMKHLPDEAREKLRAILSLVNAKEEDLTRAAPKESSGGEEEDERKD